jgi:hypothetical protein
MISETEARNVVFSLGTAMLNDDKEAREMLYSDLDNDSLKRVIRWAMRHNLQNFASLAIMSGYEPKDAWAQLATYISLIEGDDNATDH